MNKNDSERIAGLLDNLKMRETLVPEKADLLIINTCSVRQAAEDRVVGIVRNWQEIKKNNPKTIIALTGCMPGRDIDGRLKRKFPGVDLWFGIDELLRLPAWLNELGVFGSSLTKMGEAIDYLSIDPTRENKAQAFITIQTGCNNFCSYCVVPYARGRERNRPVVDIVAEATDFAQKGGLMITLLGQVVNHYIAPDPENFSDNNPFLNCHSRESGNPAVGSPVKPGMTSGDSAVCHFAALLWELNQIPGLNRVHFMAPDPQYFNQTQIEALALPKQINYLHLPAQSGDNEILRKMTRKYTREQYIDLVKKIRAARPGIALGTDLIVGFCGETTEQFKNTLDLYRQCDFDIAYIAMYSERSGTVAAKAFKDDVPRPEKKRRWDELQTLMEQTVLRKNQQFVGKKVEVLVESCDSGICSGNSREMKLTQFLGRPEDAGKIAKVEIFSAQEWVLKGK